jgi:hypothetical protein
MNIGGAVSVSDSTASTSTSTGALVVTGGVGVGGDVNVGGSFAANDVTLTDVFNTGVTLGTDSWSTGRISVRSPIINLKTVAETNIFTVPTGFMFLIDSMEVVTTAVSGAGVPPAVRFGTTATSDAFYGPTQVTSNTVGARHIIENPQDGVSAGSIVTFGVTTGSTGTSHSGCAIVSGFLFKTT